MEGRTASCSLISPILTTLGIWITQEWIALAQGMPGYFTWARELRQWLYDRHVLNCLAHTGAYKVYQMRFPCRCGRLRPETRDKTIHNARNLEMAICLPIRSTPLDAAWSLSALRMMTIETGNRVHIQPNIYARMPGGFIPVGHVYVLADRFVYWERQIPHPE